MPKSYLAKLPSTYNWLTQDPMRKKELFEKKSSDRKPCNKHRPEELCAGTNSLIKLVKYAHKLVEIRNGGQRGHGRRELTPAEYGIISRERSNHRPSPNWRSLTQIAVFYNFNISLFPHTNMHGLPFSAIKIPLFIRAIYVKLGWDTRNEGTSVCLSFVNCKYSTFPAVAKHLHFSIGAPGGSIVAITYSYQIKNWSLNIKQVGLCHCSGWNY